MKTASHSWTTFSTRAGHEPNRGLRYQHPDFGFPLPHWRPLRCLALAKAGQVVSVTCEEMLDEYREVLVRKFRLSSETARLAADEVRGISRVVSISGALTGVSPDPDDHKVLECAVAGGATHIITGDRRHLLPLGQFQGVLIVTAAEFLIQVSQAQ